MVVANGNVDMEEGTLEIGMEYMIVSGLAAPLVILDKVNSQMVTDIGRQQANNGIRLSTAATSTNGGCACCNSRETLELVATFTVVCLSSMQNGSGTTAEMTRGPAEGGSTRRHCQPCQCSDSRRAGMGCYLRMITKMWSVRHFLHVRGYKNPQLEMIKRGIISYFDIKKKIKELGSKPWDNVYYQKKVAHGNSMVELTDDHAGMMNMLEEFDAYTEISLHV